jgi:hypothetical protein
MSSRRGTVTLKRANISIDFCPAADCFYFQSTTAVNPIALIDDGDPLKRVPILPTLRSEASQELE